MLIVRILAMDTELVRQLCRWEDSLADAFMSRNGAMAVFSFVWCVGQLVIMADLKEGLKRGRICSAKRLIGKSGRWFEPNASLAQLTLTGMIAERMRDGLAAVREDDRVDGRPVAGLAKVELILMPYGGYRFSIPAICTQAGISRSTLFERATKRPKILQKTKCGPITAFKVLISCQAALGPQQRTRGSLKNRQSLSNFLGPH